MTNRSRSLSEEHKENRRQRIPVSAPRNILTFDNQDPKYVYRWVHDVEDRIARHSSAGYVMVHNDGKVGEETVNTTDGLSDSVVSIPAGGGTNLFLMAIPKEYYDEDFQRKMEMVSHTEEATQEALNEQNRFGNINID